MNKNNHIPEHYRDFIHKISHNLRLTPPLYIAPLFLKWSVISALPGIINIAFHARNDLLVQLTTPLFYIPVTLLLIGLGLGMYGVLNSGFPGRESTTTRYLVFSSIGVGLWGLWYLAPLGNEIFYHHTLTLDNGVACSIHTLLLATPPLLSGLFLIRKLAPTKRRQSSLFLFAMATLIGVLIMNFLCPAAHATHILTWHFLPVTAMSIIGAMLGTKLLKW